MAGWIAECLAANDIAALFERLGWTRVDVPIVEAAWPAWGWHGTRVPARIIAREPGCRVVLVEAAFIRDLVAAVARHAPLEQVLWCFSTCDELIVAAADQTSDRVRVRRMIVDRCRPDVMSLERLGLLDRQAFARPSELDASASTAGHLREVLDAEGLTRVFFAGFRELLAAMADEVQHGPDASPERADVALVVMLRLVFVYFLQREGMLDGDRRYIARRLRRCVAEGRDDFWEEVVSPLFFGALNTEVVHRCRAARQLGDVPFLNGGLFEPTELEVAHPRMRWGVETLERLVELFERFHFTAAEPDGADDACVVDPEMLGKVFEGLMVADDRRASGSFYTPRDVVRQMVDEALDGYLRDRGDDGVDASSALRAVRILDPAVGTGAFLLEAFATLRRRRRELGLPTDYAALREVVHDHLFGVDCNRTAVRLCELRIWLAMLGAMRAVPGPIEPLPNLSHRIVAGDSLLGGVDVLRRRSGALHAGALVRIAQVERRLEQAQREFLGAHGEHKRTCRKTIANLERELQLELIAGRRRLLERRLQPLVDVERSVGLFGAPMATARQEEAASEIRRALDHLAERECAIRSGRTGACGFAYETRFGAVAREGFDIIVTNPPWVRAQRVDAERRAVLADCFDTARSTLWPGARELGIRTPYGGQPDLAALFVERSLELLRPGGRLAALIPAKLFRALHASPLRRLLEDHHVDRVEDLSEADRQLFDAAAYPGILHVRKAMPQSGPVEVRVWRGRRCSQFRRARERLTLSGQAGEPWMLVPEPVHAVIAGVCREFPALGTDPMLTPRRGIFTGANHVFVRSAGAFERELGEAVRPFVRPFVTGAGLGDRPAQEVLWCYEGAHVLESLPAELERYFQGHEKVLKARRDYSGGPLWQVFRARADTCASKVAWRDMSMLLDPVLVDAGPVTANTVYYVAFDDSDAAAGFSRWMRSPLVRTCAHALAEHARGGWRRHFAWVVRMLPIPAVDFDWASFDDRLFRLRDDHRALLQEWLYGDEEAA